MSTTNGKVCAPDMELTLVEAIDTIEIASGVIQKTSKALDGLEAFHVSGGTMLSDDLERAFVDVLLMGMTRVLLEVGSDLDGLVNRLMDARIQTATEWE